MPVAEVECFGLIKTIVQVQMSPAMNLNRKAYGFEIKKNFFMDASKWIEQNKLIKAEIKEFGYAKTEIEKQGATLFT